MAEDAQPVEGQGPEPAGSPYDSYLQTVPGEAREAAEQWFRDTSKGLDAKLQEAAEIKKAWEPFQEQQEVLTPFRENPGQLAELIGWWQNVTSDEDAYKAWLTEAAKEAGITPQEAQEELAEAEASGEIDPEQINAIVEQRLAERLSPFEQQFTQAQEEQQVAGVESEILDDFRKIEASEGIKLSDEQKAEIMDLGLQFKGDGSWVQHGFDRYQGIFTEGQKLFVSEKTAAPGVPMAAGGSAALPGIASFDEAKEALRERLRQQT